MIRGSSGRAEAGLEGQQTIKPAAPFPELEEGLVSAADDAGCDVEQRSAPSSIRWRTVTSEGKAFSPTLEGPSTCSSSFPTASKSDFSVQSESR